jgi:hypothetical protein
VKSSELATLLQELYRDKHALRDRHVEGAKAVSIYEFNNTYQYVINREDVHLAWIRGAIVDAGAAVPAEWPAARVPEGRGEQRQRAIIEDDARAAQAFHDRWAPRLETVTHARHRNMMLVVLGEMLEQRRFFDQMLEGREDVLGRRMAGASTGGGVLPTRWVE